jgi:hypothetical protein
MIKGSFYSDGVTAFPMERGVGTLASPLNIQGATPGNYIIPLRNADGSIGIAAVAHADMSFSQYQSAVGRVISILADGRANVIVKAV